MQMIYLNHAATSWPKPRCVTETLMRCMQRMPDAQNRSNAGTEENITEACRRSLGEVFGLEKWERIFFTSGATESANLFLRGMDWTGCQIWVTEAEHNCILRPLWNSPELREKVRILPCDEKGYISRDALKKMPPGKGAVIINHCSNVTGTVQRMEEIAGEVKRKGYFLAVDISQSAGCVPITGDKWGADVLIFTGHKGLLGPQGTGGIYIREGMRIKPLKYGGTGRDSAKLLYDPDEYEYEPGTMNIPAVAALKAGADYIRQIGIDEIARKEREDISLLISKLGKIEGLRLFGPGDGEERGPVLSFSLDGLMPSDITYILRNSYGIIVREGLQCAPLIHERIGSGKNGTVRVSVSWMTKQEELDSFVKAVGEIGGAMSHADSGNQGINGGV